MVGWSRSRHRRYGPAPRLARAGNHPLRSTVELATTRTARSPPVPPLGPVCTLGVGPTRNVFLLGTEANRFVLGNSELFRWREAVRTGWSWSTVRPR